LEKYKEADIRPLLQEMIEQNINLTFIELNPKTNKMVKVMKTFYEN